MNDLISKSRLKDELLKIPSEMGLIKKAWVMQAVNKQKIQDGNNNCNCQHNSNSRENEPCCRCDSKQTNADRIRNMSDEELTEFITGLSKHCLAGIGKCDCSAYKTCDNCNVEVKNWLQSEAKEIATNMENLDVRR